MSRPWVRRTLVLALWAGVAAMIWVSVVWGRRLQRESPEVFLGAAPFVGRNFRDGWDWRFGWGLVGAGAVAVVVVGMTVRDWWWRVRLRFVVLASSVGALLFAGALALTDGADGLRYGAAHQTEYLQNLGSAPPATEFVRTFVGRINDYTVHARGHPPGFILLLKALAAIGMSGVWPAVRAVAGDDWTRRAAPLLVVAPAALWMVTSADAVYAAVGAWGVAACAVGLRSTGWRSPVAGVSSGLLLGGLLFLTYGGAVFLLVPLVQVVAALRRRPRHTLVVVTAISAGAAAVTGVFTAAGFWWFAGLAATRREYWEGTAQFRTWTYFGIANLVVAVTAIGPATFAGLTRLRDRSVWSVAGAGLLALTAAHLSQYSRGEVERIWLIFFPWLVVAGAVLVRRNAPTRTATWIVAQATTAIVLQAALVSKW